MKLYIDRDTSENPYLVTDDGELVYVEELWEDGRDTDQLNQAVSQKAGVKEGDRVRYTEPGGYDLD